MEVFTLNGVGALRSSFSFFWDALRLASGFMGFTFFVKNDCCFLRLGVDSAPSFSGNANPPPGYDHQNDKQTDAPPRWVTAFLALSYVCRIVSANQRITLINPGHLWLVLPATTRPDRSFHLKQGLRFEIEFFFLLGRFAICNWVHRFHLFRKFVVFWDWVFIRHFRRKKKVTLWS